MRWFGNVINLLTIAGASAVIVAAAAVLSGGDQPMIVSQSELGRLTAGTGSGYSLAQEAQSHQDNPCYYCANLPKPSLGSVGCLDSGFVLTTGGDKYDPGPTLDCSPLKTFSAWYCGGVEQVTTDDCSTTKNTWIDP